MTVVICERRELGAKFPSLDIDRLDDAAAGDMVHQVAALFRRLRSDQDWLDVLPALSARAENALKRAGAKTVADVQTLLLGYYRYHGNHVRIKGAGQHVINELQHALAMVG